MATNTQNLFEKYGIKEVADVTIYRIEKKEETYEAQRTISVASILKGAVELRTVYPIIDGKSTEDGFEAYVFTNADVLTGANYDCDDGLGTLVTKTIEGSFKVTDAEAFDTTTLKDVETLSLATVGKGAEGATDYVAGDPAYDTGMDVSGLEFSAYTVTYTTDTDTNVVSFVATATATAGASEETETGVVSGGAQHAPTVADADKFPGTHEYSYAEQAFMLFAKRQNLITKTGTRYHFADPAALMGGLTFEDRYSLSPNSTDKVVVLGLKASVIDGSEDASWTDVDYDVDEINDALVALGETFTAKAYDVTYNLYAELVVEDEMGYFNPNFLGTKYNKSTKSISGNYNTEITNKDSALANAVMWGENIHFSINDAIAALRQELKVIDSDSTTADGIKKLYGGYKVSSALGEDEAITAVGKADTENGAEYTYYNGENAVTAYGTSQYSLAAVLDKLDELAAVEALSGKDVAVDYTAGKESNRAIYVDVSGANVAAASYIYLLHNKNYRKLSADTEGVFTFADKKNNKVFYQDRIFAKTEWLALVIVGTKGFIFVVNRNGQRTFSKIAWMVSDGSFINDKAAKTLVANGLIHTTDVTINNETFEATCAVSGLNVRTTVKTANRYTPVLFLDTLKLSTIAQTAEEVYATGGRGNANLVGWDFGKSITLNLQDALFTPASMAATLGAYDGNDFRKGVKDTKVIDRTEKVIAKRSFIVPAGNQNGTPTEADQSAQAVFIDLNTMEPYADGTPIAEGETFLKWTRSVAYEGQSIGKTIEISADKFPGTYKIVGDTFIKNRDTGVDERFQFVVPQAKMQSEQTIELQAAGEPVVFDMNMTVLRPDDGIMVKFIQYDVIENTEENDGSKMVKGTENLNLLDDAELFKVDGASNDEIDYIGATEY